MVSITSIVGLQLNLSDSLLSAVQKVEDLLDCCLSVADLLDVILRPRGGRNYMKTSPVVRPRQFSTAVMLDSHRNLRQLLCWWLVTALTFAPASCNPTSNPSDDGASSESRETQVAYDEYPVVVPKRAALLLDRLMVALEKAVESEAAEKGMTNRIPVDDSWKMDLQRRGQKNGRTYWRCYFNAVTCF